MAYFAIRPPSTTGIQNQIRKYNLYCEADIDKDTTEQGVFIDVGKHRLFTKIYELSKGEDATIYGVAAEGISIFEEKKNVFALALSKTFLNNFSLE